MSKAQHTPVGAGAIRSVLLENGITSRDLSSLPVRDKMDIVWMAVHQARAAIAKAKGE